jgi:GH24 family phage-related lysozyme (muramidase)
MIPIDKAKWREHFIEFEGNYSFFYLDGEGVITVGIGCQVFSTATLLPMLRRVDSTRASLTEILAEIDAIKALPSGRIASFYGGVATLYLPPADVDDLFESRLEDAISRIETSLTPLAGFPELACMVLVDMAFNLGVWGLRSKFPHFMNAFVAKDWKTAALECKREGIQKSRNDWARASLESLIQS